MTLEPATLESADFPNPLLTRHSEIPFDALHPDQVVPAVEKLLTSTTAELDNIKKVSGPRTFNNTMRALDDLGVALDCAVGLVGHIENVATTPEWRAAYNQVLPVVSLFKSKIVLDAELWTAIKEYSGSPEAATLTGAKARFLKKTVDDFRRSGADLGDDSKSQMSAVSTELSQVTNQFSQNVLDATNQFEFVATSLEQLKGLPESAIALGKASAESKGVGGWRFTLQAPSFIPIMTYLEDRSVREHFYRAYNLRCTQGPLENVSLLYKILELRQKKADLLGFKDFSDLVLAEEWQSRGSGPRSSLTNYGIEFLSTLRANRLSYRILLPRSVEQIISHLSPGTLRSMPKKCAKLGMILMRKSCAPTSLYRG